MNAIKDGGPAFPCQPRSAAGHFINELQPGMSLRDYFAAHAMQALIAADANCVFPFSRLAKDAYGVADALLKAREAQP